MIGEMEGLRSKGMGCGVGREAETYMLAKAINVFLGGRSR